MKTSEALKLTKRHIWDGYRDRCYDKERYICLAALTESITVHEHVKYVVMPLLGDCETLEAWLYKHYRIHADSDMPKLQHTRHKWIEHLIQHYENLGD